MRFYQAKKVHLWIAIVLAVVLLIAIHVNFRRYGFYYATHMPHAKDEYPFVREIAHSAFPESVNRKYQNVINQDRGKRLQSSGYVFANNVYRKGDELYITPDYVSYTPFHSEESIADVSYDFSSFRYRLKNEDYFELKKNPRYRKEVLKMLSVLEKRLKRESPQPKINLQWLYNLRYLSL
jgi:hypothetical protein